jgi:hypothetical protein
MPGTIKFIGGLALLISGLTGPSLAVIPLLYQQSGWLTCVVSLISEVIDSYWMLSRSFLAFAIITVLTGAAALFLVEAMVSISGNESFQASIEFTTIAELFLGHQWQWALQIVLYLALQSQTLASLIESFQVI